MCHCNYLNIMFLCSFGPPWKDAVVQPKQKIFRWRKFGSSLPGTILWPNRWSRCLSATCVKISQGCWLNNPVTTLLTWLNRIGKITVLFNHVSTYCYSLANRQGLFAYIRTCKTWLDTTTKFMAVVTSLFNLVISSFPDHMFYHA